MAVINSYLSHQSLGHINPSTLFVNTFDEGVHNLKIAFIGKKTIGHSENVSGVHSAPSKLNFSQRIKHFIIGLGLMIPLVNTIVFVALRCFAGTGPKTFSNSTEVPITKFKSSSKKEYVNELLNKVIYQVESHSDLVSDRPFMSSVKHVKEVFAKLKKNGTLAVDYACHNHLLHWHLTKITKKVASLSKVKELWSAFLYRVQKEVKLIYPDNKLVPLDLSREKKVSTNPDSKNSIDIYQTKSIGKKELKEILEIERESFTLSYPTAMYQHYARGKNGRYLLLAKDSKTKQVVGSLLCDNGHILSLARRANAVSMGVGWKLFAGLAVTLVTNKNKPKHLKLEARPSNTPAISLYEKLGFRTTSVTKENYYSYPAEPASKMKCEYTTFINRALRGNWAGV